MEQEKPHHPDGPDTSDPLSRPARLKWLPRRLHPPEAVPQRHMRLLWLVGIANLIADYDVSLYAMSVEQIRQDLNIPESQITTMVAIFRTGIFPALILAYMADIFGRRTLLMITLAGATAGTVATAFATDMVTFTIAQTVARTFIYAEELLCIVVIAEEFSQRTRGWAVGALGALAASGAGLAALAFAFVDVLPYGWRALYFAGAIPLLWLLWARRSLPETQRFKTGLRSDETFGARWIRPLWGLVMDYPARLALLVATVLPFAFGTASAVILQVKYLQTDHQWAPWMVSALIIGGGLLAVVGNFAAGLVSDLIGRKTVLAIAILVVASAYWFFFGHVSGFALVPVWVIAVFAIFAAGAILASLGAELFPTSYRAVASGVRLFAGLFGGAIGLVLEGRIFAHGLTVPLFGWQIPAGSHPEAVSILLLATPLALLPLAFLPEPASRALESVSPEKR